MPLFAVRSAFARGGDRRVELLQGAQAFEDREQPACIRAAPVRWLGQQGGVDQGNALLSGVQFGQHAALGVGGAGLERRLYGGFFGLSGHRGAVPRWVEGVPHCGLGKL